MDILGADSVVVTLGTNEVRNLVLGNLVENGRLPQDTTPEQVRITFPATGGARVTFQRAGIRPRKPRASNTVS